MRIHHRLFPAGICWLTTWILATSILATSLHAEDEKAGAIKRDREKIAGTWRIVSIEVGGNQVAAEDARKFYVVNGNDGTWSLHSAEQEISKGTSTFDPTQSPKTIDFAPTEGGGVGNTYLGIYELGEKTRKVCFSQPGKGRPSEFASPNGSEDILVVFEREQDSK